MGERRKSDKRKKEKEKSIGRNAFRSPLTRQKNKFATRCARKAGNVIAVVTTSRI